ncbi:SDR family NAD(P)-dependent oxidoreductase [Pseudoduganella violacea]|uniref:Polyketide synthase PksM n=1 Tax=Pseudoduganella violacea TaxID=1715466 RepID=A0A7W5FVN4_9BURK|nr:SDR family NAD(P)-dependent oxidoreductase [Pseudoduganella violacea]MBB3120979.1 polyketide synthase PksM [Pseudoduganella violacea]
MSVQNLQAVLRQLSAGEISPERAKQLLRDAARQDAPLPRNRQDAIAIVGMAGRYPGSPDMAAYWDLLASGTNAVREIPASRWDVSHYFDPVPGRPGKVYCKWLGMLDGAESFDPMFFRIPPAEAALIDPQHRLFLQTAYHAFEDAGLHSAMLDGANCGVYMGIMSSEYGAAMARAMPDAGFSSSNPFSIGVARIAYHLNLKGPAIPIDTACSSSLVAVHLACQALRAGEIDLALAGGVSLYLSADAYIGMCAAGMLSPRGACSTFDREADGFVPGEGVGALVLKRLADAERDGDNIVGLIAASGINQDGRTNGITAPSAAAQTALQRDVYQRHAIDAATIQYAEMHGTGTKLGDPVELEALSAAFRADSDALQYCAIGSVKTNLGHTSAAAGVASVQKVLLSMRHGQIPPSLHFKNPNEHFDFAASPLYVNTALSPWQAPAGQARRACVSSFGFSGTNAHLVLEQYQAPPRQPARDDGAQLVLLSARTGAQLDALIQAYLPLARGDQASLAELAYASQTTRAPMAQRLALRADSLAQLARQLAAAAQGDVAPGSWRGPGKARPKLDVAAALKARDLDALGAYWAGGGAVDWQAWYGGAQRPARQRLPLYPFAQERHWFSAPAPEAGPAPLAHPWLGRRTRIGEEERIECRIERHAAFLVDHRVGGQAVVPGAWYLELVRAALCQSSLLQAAPGAAPSLRDVRWHRPLDGSQGAALVLTLTLDAGAGELVFRVNDDALPGAAGLYCSGRASFAGMPDESIDIAQWRQQHCAPDRVAEGAECYALFDAMGLHYGPSHRLLGSLQHGATHVLARLALAPGMPADDGAVLMPPGIVDAALQGVLGLALGTAGDGAARLPAGIDRLDVLASCRDAAWIAIEREDASGDRFSVAIRICREDGRVCARLQGLVLAETAAAPATVLLQAGWAAPRQPSSAPAAPASLQHVILLGRLARHAERLPGCLPDALVSAYPIGATETGEAYAALVQRLADIGREVMRTPGEHCLLQIVLDQDPASQALAGVAGLLRTAALETPRLRGQVIELDAETAADAERVAAAVQAAARCGADTLRYADAVLRQRELHTLPADEAPAPWRDDGHYWITGGMGALGALLADEILAHAPRARILLSGRSAPAPQGAQRLAEWRARGASVDYRQLDISDGDAVQALVGEYCQAYGPFSGVVHAAGTRRDALLLNKQDGDIAAVLRPKVAGLLNIDRATAGMRLDFLLMFSSVAAWFGNAGQADYAAANGFLDAHAALRKALVARGERSGLACSIAWPLWDAAGMQPDPDSLAAMAAAGLRPLPPAAAWRCLYAALRAGAASVAVLHGDAARLAAWQRHGSAPLAGTAEDSAAAAPDEAQLAGGLAYFKAAFADAFGIPADDIVETSGFDEYGVDSIVVMRLTRQLEQLFGPLPKTLFFEYRRLDELTAYFLQAHAGRCAQLFGGPAPLAGQEIQAPDRAPSANAPLSAPQPAAPASAHAATAMPIAVIGIAGRYPKANDLEQFWSNLAAGLDCIEPIPAGRWDAQRFDTYAKWGGFIDGHDEFDPLFFNLSPKEARIMDPQERLFLQCASAALEDAGYPRAALGAARPHGKERNIGVFAGVMYEEYQLYGAQHTLAGRQMALPGNAASVANRVSHFFDLHGPSMAVDSMCSSSLTALSLACDSLASGACRIALAGGVNLSVHPNKFIALAQGRFASSSGRCASFGEGGDGYVPGEGVGVVLLKPLAQAEADGDRIHGVIRAVAINHGGKANGFTVPNPDAQAEVIGRAYRRAGVEPRLVSYVEAHGTGTALGDPIELAGLNKAFRDFTDQRRFCAIGSVKSMIGHCESAAGISALTKVLLQMRHGKLAPSLHAATVNPHLAWEDSPFFLQRELTDWVAPEYTDASGQRRVAPRIAGISSFGAGGANAHVVVEQYQGRPAPEQPTQQREFAVLLTARDPARLQEAARQLRAALAAGRFDAAALPDLAYTLQTGRDHWECRLALVVRSLQELETQLDDYLTRPGQAGHASTLAKLPAVQAPQAFAGLAPALAAWLDGAAVDWLSLPGARRARRIGAPTYPFARERYWIDAPAMAAPGAGAWLHPLLQRNHSTFAQHCFISHFSGDEAWFADHRVAGRKLLSGAAQLELARAAIEQASAQATPALQLQNIAWLRPLAADAGTTLRVTLNKRGAERVLWQIETENAGGWQACSSGEAVLTAPAPMAAADLGALLQTCGQRQLDSDTAYRTFESMGIEYGPFHRGLARLHLGDGMAVARLDLPQAAGSGFVLHPGLLDAAFQAALGVFAGNGGGGATMPFSLDALDIHGPLTPSMYAVLRVSELAAARPELQVLDIDLYDQHGAACASARNLCLRASQPAALPAAPVLAARAEPARMPGATGDLLFAPRWEIAAVPPSDGFVPDLIVGAGPYTEQELRRSFGAARLAGMGGWADPALAGTLAATRALLWLAPEGEAGDCVMACFHWIKALLAAGAGRHRLDCLFVTRNAVACGAAQRADPAQAAIHGLVGALAKEYPHWQVRLADLAAEAPPAVEEMLRLPASAAGDALAHRQGLWLRAGLLPVAPHAVVQSAYRQGGVYLLIGGAGGLGVAYSEYLIRQYDAQVVWLGRRPADAAIQAQLARLAQLGRAPLYLPVDAADAEALCRAGAEVAARFGALHGVVHAAMVLQDSSLAELDETGFARVLHAKVQVAHGLAALARQQRGLDFVLFFSSFNAFARNAGQSNYAAGCTYADAFAQALRGELACRVKVINWGYWGSIGAVATPAYRKRMAELGIGSIETGPAMAALELLLASAHEQLAMVHALRPHAPAPVYRGWLLAADQAAPVRGWRAPPATRSLDWDAAGMAELEQALLERMAAQLRLLDWPAEGVPQTALAARLGIAGRYRRWFDASVSLLLRQGYLGRQGADTVLPPAQTADTGRRWPELRQRWSAGAGSGEQLALVDATLEALPAILRGDTLATDIMFPGGSMAMVAGVYQGSAVADHFNAVLGDTLLAYLEQCRQAVPAARLRILEIGAGSGATTAALLARLQPFAAQIEEYCYTDLSKAFLAHGRNSFGAAWPQLECRIFDVEQAPTAQGLAAGHYDVVIAANVLHATRKMQTTLAHAHALLKQGGLLLLNELSTFQAYTHLTFGLLDGWWRFDDDEVRLAGSPGLAPRQWQAVLELSGFQQVAFPAAAAHAAGQQVVAAFSDGVVLLPAAVETPAAPQAPSVAAAVVPPRSVATAGQRDSLLNWLRQLIGATLEIDPARIAGDQTLERYGIDSITVQQITSGLRAVFDDVPASLLFEHNTLDALAGHFLARHAAAVAALLGEPAGAPAQTAPAAPVAAGVSDGAASWLAGAAAQDDAVADNGEIAVIGLAGRYPHAATLDELWQLLRSGRSAIGEIPAARWNWRDYAPGAAGGLAPISSRYGGFIDEIDRFDPLFFQIAMAEAHNMDPQERLFVEQAYCCIEDAGHVPATLSRDKRVGVYVGVMNANYPTGVRHWSIANRISYLFDFRGPSMAVDSACSSSLTALHLALDALRSGSIDCALVGGVNLVTDPAHYQRLSAMNMLSDGPQVRAFGAHANGFVDGEGVGAMLLKPLRQALADGDDIHGVLLGSALNAGGKTHGYTVPSPQAQADVLAQAYQRAGVTPRMVSYVEAHGTGTALGDPIEVRGLTLAFERHTQERQFCALGSVKTNIGHTESAAGIAGVTKVLLQMKHRMLAPTLHAEQANPEIDFTRTPFRLQHSLQAWDVPVGGARIASVSSFGAGGANAAVVLREHVSPAPAGAGSRREVLVLLSARDPERLLARARQLLALLAQDDLPSDALERIAYTLQAGRLPMDERLALRAATPEQLRAGLRAFISGAALPPGCFRASLKEQRQAAPVPVDAARVQAWFDGGDWEQLGLAWSQGLAVDWVGLHGTVHPQRLHLPAYPFQGERYGVTRLAATPGAPAAQARQPLAPQDIAGREAPAMLSLLAQGQPATPPPAAPLTLLQPVWRATPQAGRPGAAQATLLLGSDAARLAALQAGAPHARVHVCAPDAPVEEIGAALAGAPALQRLVWLAPQGAALASTDPALAQAQRQRVIALLRCCKALLAAGYGTRPLTLTVLTRQAVAIGDDDELRPEDAAVHGLAATLAAEYPHWRIELLDLPARQELAWDSLQGLELPGQGKALAYRAGRWYRQHLAPGHALPEAATPYRQGGVYVVAGGAGGIGAAWSAALIRSHRARIVWLGRRAPDAGIEAAIAAAADGGLAPEYWQVDAADVPAMRAACAAIKARHGAIHGVLHSALVLADQSVAEMSEARFISALHAKAGVALGLAAALAGEPLDFMLFFSSMIAFGGAPGQANYAAGCTFQDALARKLDRELPYPVKTVNWGYWGSVGAVAHEAYRLRMASLGIGSIEVAEGLGLLRRFLGGAAGQLGVLKTLEQDNTGTAVADEAPALLDLLGSQQGGMLETLQRLAGQRIGVAPPQLDADCPLLEYGFDAAGFEWLARACNELTGNAEVLTGADCARCGTLRAIAAWLEARRRPDAARRALFQTMT